MYDYMKALQKRFDRQEHSKLDAHIKSAHEELHDDNPFATAQCTEGEAHGGGGLPLAVAPVKMQQALFHHPFSLVYCTVSTRCRMCCSGQSRASST